MNAESRSLADADYAALLAFRTGLRRFLAWSAQQAKAAGITPSQHQLLLAIRGSGDPSGPAISDVAEVLLLRHHSAVELVDRAEAAGLVLRRSDAHDARLVRLALTPLGARRLAMLAALHREELVRLRPRMEPLWAGLDQVDG
jgi:DNA-binding MarR family transcriptional regulator